MSKRKKLIIGFVIGLLIVVMVALLYGGNYLVSYALERQGDGGNRDEVLGVEEVDFDDLPEHEKRIESEKDKYDELVDSYLANNVRKETVDIQSKDGIKLKGHFYIDDVKNHNDWVILIHGYRSDHVGMLDYMPGYFELGYNVLAPDMRASGESEGQYITMGWHEKEDLKLWIDLILERDPDANIVLHGQSMGAATVLMYSGEDGIPSNIKAIVADSGYTSVWDIFASELELRFGLPEFPLLHIADHIANFRANFKFSEASSLEQVKKADLPILFLHGKEDDFVPFYMMEELYEAKPDPKDYMVSEYAGHVEALYDLNGESGKSYFEKIEEFLNQYVD